MNNEIKQKAADLGKLIIEEKVYADYLGNKLKYEADGEVQGLLKKFEELREEVDALGAAGDTDKMKEKSSELQKLFETINGNKTVIDYFAARREVENILGEINNIITFYINGEEEGGCDESKCASCKGCNH